MRRGGEAGWGTPALPPCFVGLGESGCLSAVRKGVGVPKLAGRIAAVRWRCGLFKQLGDPPSKRRKSCHRHPQQAIKSDFPFQGRLVPLLGFSPLCKRTHTHTHQAGRAKNRLWVAAWEISGYLRGQGWVVSGPELGEAT